MGNIENMTTAEKLQEIYDNVDKVFEAGKKSEYDTFWDSFQDNGNRRNYNYGFSTWWNFGQNFKPKYPLFCKGNINSMFWGADIDSLNDSLKHLYKTDENGEIITYGLDLSEITNAQSMFQGFTDNTTGTSVSHGVKKVDVPIIVPEGCKTLVQAFSYNAKITEITYLKVHKDVSFNNTFSGSGGIKTLMVYGDIGTDFTCTAVNLSVDSAESIINALYDYGEENSSHKVTLNSGVWQKLNAQKPREDGLTWELFANSKGWNT